MAALALTPAQRALLDALDAAYVHAPFERSWWLGHGYISLRKVGSRFLVRDIWIDKRFRGAGHGRRMLATMIKKADACGVDLFIFARPFDAKPRKGDGMTQHQLAAWYARAGFRPYSRVYHLRRAR